MNKRILGSSNNNVKNIIPVSNKYINDLQFDIDFNNKLAVGFSQGLGIFEGHPEKDQALIRKIDTTPLKNTDFDKLNKMLSNVKPLTSGDVIGIGIDKIKQDTKDVFNGFGDYIDSIINYLKDLIKMPLTLFALVLLVFLILK